MSGAPKHGSIITLADPDGEAQAPKGLHECFEDQWWAIVCESFTAANSSAALAERRGFSSEFVGSKDSLEEYPGSQGASDSFGEDAPKSIPEDEAATCRFIMGRLLNAPVGAAILYEVKQGARLARMVARELPQCVLILVLDKIPESGASGGEGLGAAMPAYETLANAGEARNPGAFNIGHTQGSIPTSGTTTHIIPFLTDRGIPCLIDEATHNLEAMAAFFEEVCPTFPLAHPCYESEQALKAFAGPEMGRREYRELRESTARDFTAS